MTGIARDIRGIGRRWLRPSTLVKVVSPEELLEYCHWSEPGKVRLEVPISLLRMQGGFTYDLSHPFVQALNTGKTALWKFYEEFQPRSIAEFHKLYGVGRNGEDLPAWEVPWYLRKTRTPPPGENKLGPEHGVSFYGPATEQKVDLEMSRLRNVCENIKKKGFDPDTHGDIEGYVLRDGVKACFFVRGGKHRAAALASLGYDRVPVAFRRSFPRLIDTCQADYWPLVRNGSIDKSLAQDVLRVYTHAAPNKWKTK